MTPKTMKMISYFFICTLIIISVYPFVKDSFFVSKYSDMAILGSTGVIGDYPYEVQLSEETSLQIFLENHEKQTKLYKIVIKLVDDQDIINNKPPFDVNIVASYFTVIENNKNSVIPIKIVIDQPFTGKLVAELYMFDTTKHVFRYYDRWVAIWIKITE